MDHVQIEAISEAFLKSKQSPMIFAEMINLCLCDTSLMRLMCKRDQGLVAGSLFFEEYRVRSAVSAQDLEKSYHDALTMVLKDEEKMFFNNLQDFRLMVPNLGITAEWLHTIKHDFQKSRKQNISKIVMPFICVTDILSCPDLGRKFQPKKLDITSTEYIGTLDGIDVYTDGYRPYDRKLDQLTDKTDNSVYVYALPDNCGVWDTKLEGKAKVTRDYPPELILNVVTHLL